MVSERDPRFRAEVPAFGAETQRVFSATESGTTSTVWNVQSIWRLPIQIWRSKVLMRGAKVRSGRRIP